MKKYIIVIIMAIISFISCEQDSICIDATTPNLVIRFYDFDNRSETKSVLLDSVWAENKGLYIINESADSIAVPLDLNENLTLYNLGSNALVDQIKLNYNRKDIFVGRSCGYKTIYEDLNIESTENNWIKEIEIINTIIDNDTAAQVYIFH
jgi:hypothetical protein